MGTRLGAATAALLTLVAKAGLACTPAPSSLSSRGISCSVVGAQKLPGDRLHAADICGAVSEAVGAALAGGKASGSGKIWITVRIVTPYVAAATITTSDARRLPQQEVASADRPLNRHSFQMLGNAVAAQLAARP